MTLKASRLYQSINVCTTSIARIIAEHILLSFEYATLCWFHDAIVEEETPTKGMKGIHGLERSFCQNLEISNRRCQHITSSLLCRNQFFAFSTISFRNTSYYGLGQTSSK